MDISIDPQISHDDGADVLLQKLTKYLARTTKFTEGLHRYTTRGNQLLYNVMLH